MLFDPQHLQDIIACPKTKAKLICEGEFLISVDPETRLKYPIKDGIPVMLVDEAVEVLNQENSSPETFPRLRSSDENCVEEIRV